MSIVSKLAKKATKWTKTHLGTALPSVGSLVGSASGIPLAGLAGSIASGVKPGEDLAIGARNGALSLAGLGAAGQLGAGAAAGGAGGAAPASPAGGFLSKIPQALSSFLPSVGGLSGLLDKGLGAAQVVNAANLQKQSTGYAKDALNSVNASYDARAPLRVAGIEGLLHPQTPDLSSLSQIPGNPFAPKRPGMAPVPMPIPQGPQAQPFAARMV